MSLNDLLAEIEHKEYFGVFRQIEIKSQNRAIRSLFSQTNLE